MAKCPNCGIEVTKPAKILQNSMFRLKSILAQIAVILLERALKFCLPHSIPLRLNCFILVFIPEVLNFNNQTGMTDKKLAFDMALECDINRILESVIAIFLVKPHD